MHDGYSLCYFLEATVPKGCQILMRNNEKWHPLCYIEEYKETSFFFRKAPLSGQGGAFFVFKREVDVS